MMFLPFQILGIWFRGLLALALLGLGAYLLKQWYDEPNRSPSRSRAGSASNGPPSRPTRTGPTGERRRGTGQGLALAPGVRSLDGLPASGGSRSCCSRWAAGRWATRSDGARAAGEAKPASRGTEHRVKRPDGSELFAQTFGPDDAPPIVMTHGWSVDSTEWDYSRDALAKDHRLILWDLPGLGKSSRPANNDYSLENLAHDLDAIVGLAGGKPVILLGHSIGGMINLTYCKVFPEALGTRVAGIVQVHTTYTNPVRTTKHHKIYEALQKPVLEPLCHVMIWLAPVFWVMNWLSYLNGSLHRSSDRSSFAGTETREQLNKCALYGAKAWPGVVARGMLGMFRYDATRTMDTVPVPCLIICGDKDEMTLPRASVTMVESLPKATMHELEARAPHGPHGAPRGLHQDGERVRGVVPGGGGGDGG